MESMGVQISAQPVGKPQPVYEMLTKASTTSNKYVALHLFFQKEKNVRLNIAIVQLKFLAYSCVLLADRGQVKASPHAKGE